jgi:hypothetical protein
MTEVRVSPECRVEWEVRESTRVSVHLPAPGQTVGEVVFPSFGAVRISRWGGVLDMTPQMVDCQNPRDFRPLYINFWLDLDLEAGRDPADLVVDRLTVLDEDGMPLWTFDPRYTDGDVYSPLEWEEQEPGRFRFARVRVVSGPADDPWEELRDLPRGGRVYVRTSKSDGSPWRHRKVAIVIRVCVDGECQLLRSEFDKIGTVS